MSAPAQIVTANPELDEERRRGLRRMRTLAVSLLLFAAVVYVVTLGQDGFLGFVNAGAEASMVGAIADWFAVTAMFKHPMGLPIPHTALIPRRKDDARPQPGGVRRRELPAGDDHPRADRRRAAEPAGGGWLTEEANARRVVDEAAAVLHPRAAADPRRGHGRARRGGAAAAVPARSRSAPSPAACSGRSCATARTTAWWTWRWSEAHRWLTQNEETFVEIVAERAPWWAPPSLNDRVTHRLHVEALAWLEDIRDDPYHHARDRTGRRARRSWPRTCSTTRRRRSGWSGSRTGCSPTRSWSSPPPRCGTRSVAR